MVTCIYNTINLKDIAKNFIIQIGTLKNRACGLEDTNHYNNPHAWRMEICSKIEKHSVMLTLILQIAFFVLGMLHISTLLRIAPDMTAQLSSQGDGSKPKKVRTQHQWTAL